MGLEESKAEARRLIDEAKESLEQFGDKAAPLLALADFIVKGRTKKGIIVLFREASTWRDSF